MHLRQLLLPRLRHRHEDGLLAKHLDARHTMLARKVRARFETDLLCSGHSVGIDHFDVGLPCFERFVGTARSAIGSLVQKACCLVGPIDC